MSRRAGAWSLTLALVAVLAAAVMPPCSDAVCCARAEETAVHAQMACCEASISPRNVDLQPLKVEDRQSCLSSEEAGQAGLPVLHQVEGVGEVPAPPPAPPSPPLFLLHEQFLI